MDASGADRLGETGTTRPGNAAPIRVGFRNVLVEVRPGTVTEWPIDQAGS